MVADSDKFQRSIRACIENGKQLLENAEWAMNRSSIGLALAMLAQEECAKAFVLVLVRDDILPWTDDVRRSLSVHSCKNLVTMIVEWLSTVNELKYSEWLSRKIEDENRQHLPPDVATAMNIYRHEMIERIGRRFPERFSEWRGRARKVAEGSRDRMKQTAFYVGIGEDGDISSQPPASIGPFEEEVARGKVMVEFAEAVNRNCIFAFREYEMFREIFGTMFEDLGPGVEDSAETSEILPSDIPGVVFVKKTITVANVVPVDSGAEPS